MEATEREHVYGEIGSRIGKRPDPRVRRHWCAILHVARRAPLVGRAVSSRRPMPYAELDRCRIWYELKGSGDYLLQIPGMFFAHHNFGLVSQAMAEHFTVIDFDQRGTGLSDRPSQRYSIELWADDCALLLDALGVERAHVHGTSAAGMVAIHFAAAYPEKVDRLVIDCSAAK